VPKEIDFFTQNNQKVARLAAGHSHSGAITECSDSDLEDNTPQLYLWGANQDHRLMLEDKQSRSIPTLSILEQVKQQLIEQGRNELSLNVEPCYVSLGFSHTAVVTRSGELFTCGAKSEGQLGVNRSNFESEISTNGQEPVEEGIPITRIVQFGFENKAVKVSCGDNFTLVLNEQGQVYAFGKGSHGRLGVGQMQGSKDRGQVQNLTEDDSTLIPPLDQP
jgi:alpha-tubulin suppressor-like RCC1 family protein